MTVQRYLVSEARGTKRIGRTGDVVAAREVDAGASLGVGERVGAVCLNTSHDVGNGKREPQELSEDESLISRFVFVTSSLTFAFASYRFIRGFPPNVGMTSESHGARIQR
jgi:hypothetical protein